MKWPRTPPFSSKQVAAIAQAASSRRLRALVRSDGGEKCARSYSHNVSEWVLPGFSQDCGLGFNKGGYLAQLRLCYGKVPIETGGSSHNQTGQGHLSQADSMDCHRLLVSGNESDGNLANRSIGRNDEGATSRYIQCVCGYRLAFLFLARPYLVERTGSGARCGCRIRAR